MLRPEEQLSQLEKGVQDFISKEDLLKKLKKSYDSKTPLKIKVGFDPSRPDLHFGHLVLMRKMKVFQELGHQIIFVVGDFTAMIGDPSGKNKTRPSLTPREVKKNAKTYAKQAFKILNRRGVKMVYNNSWLGKFSPRELVELTSHYTVSRMLERDDFAKRFKNEEPLFIHEFLYPLLQGYDSVALKADVELGGTDQRFNLIVGREMQRSYGLPLQAVMTYPLLEGLDGVKKMSKSLDNYIAFNDSPKDIFGKTMRISDDLMFKYYELLTDMSSNEIQSLKQKMKEGKEHPRDVKVRLARHLVGLFHSEKVVKEVQEEFERIFRDKGLPDKLEEKRIPQQKIKIYDLLPTLGLCSSKSEARRLIQGGAFKKDREKISNIELELDLKKGDDFLIQLGKKKFLRVKVK